MKSEKTRSLRIIAGVILVLAVAILVFGLVFYTSWPGNPSVGLMFAGLGLAALLLAGSAVAVLSIASSLERTWQESEAAPARVAPASSPAPMREAPAADREPEGGSLLLLTLFQEKGRLVDFLMEDIGAYSNEQVGAAARVVHQGCRAVVEEAFAPAPVSHEPENAPIILAPGYNAAEFRVLGESKGSAPGRLVHKGWRATRVKLPRVHGAPQAGDGRIIVPAEIAP